MEEVAKPKHTQKRFPTKKKKEGTEERQKFET